MCKRGDAFSLQVLIGRGLFLFLHLFVLFHFITLYTVFLVGVYCSEVTPVPIPNTEVKLWYEENTWLATARENISMPASLFNGSFIASVFHYFFLRVYMEISCTFLPVCSVRFCNYTFRLFLYLFFWTISSVGQSSRLITGRSGVRVPDGPPVFRPYILWGRKIFC